jgi:hypothetical protein
LAYKVAAGLLSDLLLAMFFTPLAMAMVPAVPAFSGMLPIFAFLNLFGLAASQFGRVVGAYAVGGGRKLVLWLTTLAMVGAFLWLGFGDLLLRPMSLAARIDRSAALRAVLTPLRWPVEALTAERYWPDLVKWSTLGLVLDGTHVALVFDLDRRNRSAVDGRAAPRVSRVAGDDGEPIPRAGTRPRWAFRMPPSWGGAGPVAWRQGMQAVRSPGRFGFALIIYAVALFQRVAVLCFQPGLVVLPSLDGHVEINTTGALITGINTIAFILTITAGLAADFRADMGRIDILKALPVEPLPLVLGQLLVPVSISAALQWLALAIIPLVLGRGIPALWIAAAFVPPASAVPFAIENLSFLWFPLRPVGASSSPDELIGRALIHPLVRIACHVAVASVTLIVATTAFFLIGQR